ncbi:unnamed protein product [Candidula unifasciata]|uniref:Centrosomal protein of 89 kDa n=1 Tax=Candidula unifasciata TaxID=100452 RepID=A0A8S3ZSG1_9EUPU|nr:unnamed protein product [Candidula unifasciata]
MESKMVGQKNKKKSKTLGAVARALLPSSVFAAVPISGTSPAALTAPSPSSGAAAQPGTSTTAARNQRQPAPPSDDFSEPESSLYDYQQMLDAGYQTVGFGTWPARGKHVQQEAERPSSTFRSSGVYAEPGDIEGVQGRESPVVEMINYVYATPMKKGKQKSSTKNEMDDKSLTGTQKNMHAEMKRIHDLPAEVSETMTRSERQVVSSSYNKLGSSHLPDSGRGSTRPDSPEDNVKLPERSPNLAHVSEQLVRNCRQPAPALDVSAGTEVRHSVKAGEVDETPRMQLSDAEIRFLGRILAVSQGGHGWEHLHSLSGRSSRNDKSKSGQNLAVGVEAEQLKMQNAELKAELQTLRKVAEAVQNEDIESARTLYSQKNLNTLKEENEILKSAVHRLNVELSDYQAKFRPIDEAQLQQTIKINGLPPDGPVPSWLISKKYLAPLFLAYDDHLAKKDEIIEHFKNECASIKTRVEQVVAENQMLRRTGAPGLGGQGDSTEWNHLQEQAKLVLEENQILMEQLEVQTLKSKDMYKAQETEISRMARKLALSEGEKADLERELEQMRVRFREIKHKHDQLVMESDSRVQVHTHINTISDIKRSVTEEKELIEKEIDSVKVRLKASEEERRRLANELIELKAENKGCKAEIAALQKSFQRAQEKMSVLHRAIELSENKEMVTQEQLANVIKVAEKTALERDTVYQVAREQQEESKQTMNRMIQGSAATGKLQLKLKLYQMKASAKLNTIAERLREQDEAFNSQRKEYEREIQHLRSLLKEKEEIIESLHTDKKDVEKELDTMWQVATTENKRIKNILLCGTRKLKDHVHITDALKQEMEHEEILHLSDDCKQF